MIHSCRNNKQYREDNKEAILDQRKQYRADNIEKIKEHRSKKYTCDCGFTSCYDHKARHERSNSHIYRMLHIIGNKYSILMKQSDDIIKLQ